MGVGIMTMWVAWWGIRIMAASPPAMPQVMPMGVVGSAGGLVGTQKWGSVISSYATGDPVGGSRWRPGGGSE